MSRAAELAARTRLLSARPTPRAPRAEARAEPEVKPLVREEDAPGADDAPTGVDRCFGVRVTSKGVLFVQPGGPQVSIFVAGDFNGWSDRVTPMRFSEHLRVHELLLPAPPGRLRYRLVVNGQWIADPYNPDTEPNPFGGVNSYIDVHQHRTQGRSPQ